MVFLTNKNGRRHLAKQLHEREYSFSNTNTALKAPVDNNLAVIATACCEQQGLTQELKLTSIGSPGFPSSICPSSLRVMCRVSSFPEFENRLSRLPVLPLDASLLKRTLQACAMNVSFQVPSLVCGGP